MTGSIYHDRLIAVDGIDGAGKTTCVATLSKVLQQQYPESPVTQVSLLGTGAIGQTVRAAVDRSYDHCSKSTIAVWMAAAILETYQRCIKPNLDAGHCVVVDRWISSYLAYQSYAEGTQIATSLYYHVLNKELLQPALYLWLNPDLTVIKQRLALRPDTTPYDRQTEAFKRTVLNGYQEYYNDRLVSLKTRHAGLHTYCHTDSVLNESTVLQLLEQSSLSVRTL